MKTPDDLLQKFAPFAERVPLSTPPCAGAHGDVQARIFG